MNKPESRRIPVRPGAKGSTRKIDVSSGDQKAKSQMVLFGSIGGGILLLLLIIAAASSGGGGASRPGPKKNSHVAPPQAPPEKPNPKPVNFVRNTGAIVFVCGGSDKHKDMEIVLPQCPKCPAKNSFTVDGEAQAYRCSKCKAVYENADIKCDQCGRTARVTHLKKIAGGQ